ncbi:MAG: hypothetical protein UV71_C0006G0024 [Microgenomates group bacterium GW2011_GWC1_43_13]|uniref:Uncharacterized protein n=3 Tax=Candidatus Woeseibacteriota TaxID=1752722 RepID=A0A837IDB2_9BACT|nr:MAG: hypothetical protein UV71_C0006G0024 [Microgenomates group bacterium GW2011_GWC1_43_13]KKT32557.1 MAG: hypothetical protein UW20_C0012G0003 [Candidatus Woesebacteria bacterium GW2011_GWB1_44_11]KKT54294.1 MAG: hypothetical protein UW47_C0007G0014 [Candidatus Woesebacteria bacterium GW2011_GWA1_44_23]OGM76675.1 MAG: hypothetical protein A2208_03140 [Candidatus Woesebacteria bacterium RIFOXYA1_FULL_43_16]OGM83170.1 MAG: hypothetical protein A2394_02695 [Candidatus Woesebacteria bacterium 
METKKGISRGNFIKLLGIAGGASIISACEKIINPPQSTPTGAITPEVDVQHSTAPTETTQPTPTLEPTANPTPTETVEPVISLTDVEFQGKSDEELKTIAPKAKTQELGFIDGTELTPDVVVRGGKGANYILYKNLNTKNIELAWNAETGTQEHAIYATYEKEIAGEVYKGIPCLFLTDQTVLDETGGGGWLGLNPEFPDAEKRLGDAFQAALGMYYWASKIQPAIVNYAFEKGLPNFEEIPGYENLRHELENIKDRTYQSQYVGYNKAPGYLRDKIAAFMRDKFLVSLATSKTTGESMDVQFKAKRATRVDLAKQKIIVTKFFCSGEHKLGNWLIWTDIVFGYKIPSFRFITQTESDAVTLLVDQIKYDRSNYLYGGHIVGFLRYFFGDNLFIGLPYIPGQAPYETMTLGSSDYTTGFATTLCPPELQPEIIQQHYASFGMPGFTDKYSYDRAFPGQQSALKFYKSAQ